MKFSEASEEWESVNNNKGPEHYINNLTSTSPLQSFSKNKKEEEEGKNISFDLWFYCYCTVSQFILFIIPHRKQFISYLYPACYLWVRL